MIDSQASEAQEAPPTLPWAPGQPRPLDDESLTQWNARIDKSALAKKPYELQWQRGLNRYAESKVNEQKTEVNALLDYRHVESKKAALFHRTPDVTLIPVDPTDQSVPFDAMLPLRQKFLNYALGPKAANAKRALHKTLIDALAASGWMICELGFENVTLPLQTTQPGMFGQPATPMTAQIPIWSRWFISAPSSMKLLLPDGFDDSSDFDSAPWLALRGTMSLSKAKRLKWAIPDDFTGSTQGDEFRYKHGDAPSGASDPLIEYTKIWYRAAEFDAAVFNPELFRLLILVKGLDVPAWHVDSPFQSLTDQGQLTDDSMLGNPIHVGTLRDLIDSAYVPSDLVVGEQLSVELNKFRTGLVSGRLERRPMTLISDAIGKETAEVVLRDRGGVVPAEYIGEGGSQRLVAVIQAGTEPRDNFAAQQTIEADYNEALGQSPNQRGQLDAKKRTATEIRTVAGAASARAETERDRIREYFVALVRKFDAIVQRTATPQDVQKVLGQQGAQLWMQWKALPGKYAYEIMPDSGQYVDAREYQQLALDVYNLVRKDPRVNPEEPIGMVARAFHRDPARFMAPPQEKPEPAKISISFNAEQAMLNPDDTALMLAVLQQSGYKVDPNLAARLVIKAATTQLTASMQPQGEPAHGGAADRTEPINQHSADKTGGLPGVGVM